MTGRLLVAVWDAAFGVWFAVWFLTARWLFGRWRAAALDATARGCARWADGWLTLAAMGCALAWPLVLLAAGVRYHPPRAACEVEAERRRDLREVRNP